MKGFMNGLIPSILNIDQCLFIGRKLIMNVTVKEKASPVKVCPQLNQSFPIWLFLYCKTWPSFFIFSNVSFASCVANPRNCFSTNQTWCKSLLLRWIMLDILKQKLSKLFFLIMLSIGTPSPIYDIAFISLFID